MPASQSLSVWSCIYPPGFPEGKRQEELEDVTAHKRGIIFAALDGKSVEKPETIP